MERINPPRASLTEGPITPTLRGLALPMALGIVFIIAVNLADTYYVARLGTEPLAAMTFTFPIVTGVMSVAMGLSVGGTTAIARAIGHGDDEQVRRLTTHSLLLALLVVALVSGLGVLTQESIIQALGAEPALMPMITDYMTIWFAGAVFLVVPIVANGALRAAGDAKTPMFIMMGAALANMVLDPLLIFGYGPIPAMNLRGAALATLIARAFTLIISIYVLAVRSRMLDLHVPSWPELRGSWAKIVSVGAPAALTNALGPIAVALLTALVAKEGSAAIAAYGIGARVDSLLLIPPMALTSALSPFIGQNWGAHLVDRVQEAVRTSIRFSVLWGVGALVVLVSVAPWIAAVFSDDPVVQEALIIYLRVMPLGYAANAVTSVANSSFNAVDRAVRATLVSAARSLLLALPLAYIGQHFAGLAGLFAGLVVANLGAALLGLSWVRKVLRPAEELSAETLTEPAGASAIDLGHFPETVRPRVRDLLDKLAEFPEVTVCPSRLNTVGFFVGKRELGHVHPAGQLDLALPPRLGDHLVAEGRLEHHRLHHDSAWYTHQLSDADDVKEARWLLNLGHTLYELRQRNARPEEVCEGLRSLGLSLEGSKIMAPCAAQWSAAPS